MADDAMWSVSSGLMALRELTFAEKVRQARALDAVLEGFSSDDEEDTIARDAASWQQAAAKAAVAAAALPGVSASDDIASIASTVLRPGSRGSRASSVAASVRSAGSLGIGVGAVPPPSRSSQASSASSATDTTTTDASVYDVPGNDAPTTDVVCLRRSSSQLPPLPTLNSGARAANTERWENIVLHRSPQPRSSRGRLAHLSPPGTACYTY